MFEIKKQFKNVNHRRRYMDITVNDDIVVRVDTVDNSDMEFETFNLLCRNGYSFIFDFTKRIKK